MMEITLQTVTIKELVNGFEDNGEDGVFGYGGKLNIRPAYQREFVYSEKQEKAVIDSIFKDFPLNVMYWVEKDDKTFELLDGQQRTLSICTYYSGEFFVNVNGNLAGFSNLTPEQKEKFLNYPLQIYVCREGTQEEQLDWFQTINIAGEVLTAQEIRNAVYAGPWVTDAKKRFSKTGCVAYKLGEKYMSGTPIRQDYLETVLNWLCVVYNENSIEAYMARRQKEPNADREWQYFQDVIRWVERLFTNYRKEMKGVAWGDLHRRFKDKEFSATDLENKIKTLFEDEDVTNKKGIYDYVLSGDERKLNIRAFTPKMAREAYERQNGICVKCGEHFDIEEMQADHITPWSKGGTTTANNCQMLCSYCNRTKSDK